LEGIGSVTVQQAPAEYKEYDILPQQVNRLIPLLNRARNQGMLTYIIVDDGGGAIAIEDEGVSVENDCQILNFIGADVQAVSVGDNRVNVYHPMPSFSPFLGSGSGDLVWPITTPGYISRPEVSEGNPYFANGWDNKTNNHPRVNTTTLNEFSTSNGGLGITHASARVTNLEQGTITATITDGMGGTETITLTLDPDGGDQDATSPNGHVSIHVRDTTVVGGTVVEGRVYVYTDPAGMIGMASVGTGGYFKIEVNHSIAPDTADFGEAFWDNGVLPNGSANPTVTVNVPVVRWVSGIRYFDTGSTFDVVDDSPIFNGVGDVTNMTINNDGVIFKNDASEFNVVVGDVVYTSSSILGLTYDALNSPKRTDRPRYNATITIGPGDFGHNNARIYTTWKNFHGDEVGSPKASTPGIYQVWTYDTSTATTDFFEEESYRLRSEPSVNYKQTLLDYRDWYGGGTGSDLRDWDAQQSIDTGSAGHQDALQFYGGYLVYPKIDFTTGFYFSDFDYSVFGGDGYFYRAFDVGDLLNHKTFSIVFDVSSFTESDFLDGGDVQVDLMFPGPERPSPNGSNDGTYPGSGWLHCGKVYNAPTFTGVDGDGILQSSDLSGSTLTLDVVTGNFSTFYTHGTVLMRITYKSSVTGKIGQATLIGA
jgi:hypothetical protein